jgi:hypothetical protein
MIDPASDGAWDALQKNLPAGTCVIYVISPRDVDSAKAIAKAMMEASNPAPEATEMILAEVTEKGGAILLAGTGGAIVLCPDGPECPCAPSISDTLMPA